MTRSRPVACLFVAVAVAVAMVLGGCGGDDGEAADPTTTASSGSSKDTSSTAATTTDGESTTTDDSGDDSPDDTGGDVSDLCASVSDASVEAVLATVPEVATDDMLGVSSCSWMVDDDTEVAVSVGTESTYSKALEAMRPTATEQVDGVGDEAFLTKGFTSASSGGTTGLTLWVVDGGNVYAIAAKSSGGEVTGPQLRAIAADVLG